jgi:DNA polymerase
MAELRDEYLRTIGIPVWRLRSAPDGGIHVSDQSAWDTLAHAVPECTQCVLHKTRTQTVFGVGNAQADLLIIGEAPGADEDRQGEPFVGRAGQLLNAMLGAIHLSRDDVYIANILKCRPPNNRDPKPEEASACSPFLNRQIELIEPKVILALGRIAAQWLLQSDQPIGRLRGTVHSYGSTGIALVASYHPAYLLRSPLAKAKAWEDLVRVTRILGEAQ